MKRVLGASMSYFRASAPRDRLSTSNRITFDVVSFQRMLWGAGSKIIAVGLGMKLAPLQRSALQS